MHEKLGRKARGDKEKEEIFKENAGGLVDRSKTELEETVLSYICVRLCTLPVGITT